MSGQMILKCYSRRELCFFFPLKQKKDRPNASSLTFSFSLRRREDERREDEGKKPWHNANSNSGLFSPLYVSLVDYSSDEKYIASSPVGIRKSPVSERPKMK